MSFEKDFNSTSIFAGMAFTASMAGGLLGDIAEVIRHGRSERHQLTLENVPAGDSRLGLRMVERHVDYHARCALRAMDGTKRELDREGPRLSLGKGTKDVYLGLYRHLYVFPFRETQFLREWNHETYAGIAHSSGHRRLSAADLPFLRLKWVHPVQGKINALMRSIDIQHRAVCDELKSYSETHGDVVSAWLSHAGAMRESAVAGLQTIHNTMDAVMFSEIVDRRTAREFGE